jgi:hypothetical protein
MAERQNILIFIGADGLLRFVYDDDLLPLLDLGTSAIERASYVEPACRGWEADLAPSGGPVLGPFATRREALTAEVNWIQREVL